MKEKLKIDIHVLFPFLVTLLLWVIFYFDVKEQLSLRDYGVLPRHVSGLPGIVAHFFIHANFGHLLSNTLSLLVLSLLLFISYREIAFPVFAWMIPLTGTVLWLIGRNGDAQKEMVHIGASGVIFALFGFLLVSGLIRRNKMLLSLTALVIFLYGYMVWGIFPIEAEVSWDGHLSGLLSGCALAFFYRRKGPQPDKYALLEEEEDEYDKLPEEEKYWLRDQNDGTEIKPAQHSNDQLFINYHYLPKEKKNGEENDQDKNI